MKRKRISVKSLLMWEIITLVMSALIISIPWIIFEAGSLIRRISVISLAVLAAILCILYFPLHYLSIHYVVNQNIVLYAKGLLIRKTNILDRRKIVFVSVVKNPFTPFLRTCSLIIRAPGATIKIKHLSIRVAARLMRSLSPNSILSEEESL